MSKKIEEAFNECFERLLSGESLDSCLRSFPEYAAELDFMLRTAFDVKRKAYPVQPRPEFRYWSRIRMQGIQDADYKQPASRKINLYNVRRNLAISMAAILVFVLASSGTAAASSDAMPDQPLYEVKLAVEQVQLTFTPSETARAELYANLAEKRAEEIAVMASKGNNDKVLSTTTKMYYQLDQAEQLVANLESSIEENSGATFSIPASTTISLPAKPSTSTSVPTAPITPVTPVPTAPVTPVTPAITAPAASVTPVITAPPTTATTLTTPSANVTQYQQPESKSDSKSWQQSTRSVAAARKAQISVNASAAKTITILQDALDKAPDSVKPSLNAIIEHTKTTNARFNRQNSDSNTGNQGKTNPDNTTVKPLPVKPKSVIPQTVVPSDNATRNRVNNRLNIYNKGIINNQDADSDASADNR
ncbi:MAG: DUF5667 domain-containing protein [Chloroflexi bacterium]|nr:DUF5667 domain-containing protein [Chloroflexota bacterium]